jgi:MoxR-like ATPase
LRPADFPGARATAEMMELANAAAREFLLEYELPDERLTLAEEVVAEAPTKVRALELLMQPQATAASSI